MRDFFFFFFLNMYLSKSPWEFFLLMCAGAGCWAAKTAERTSQAADSRGSIRSQDVRHEPAGSIKQW